MHCGGSAWSSTPMKCPLIVQCGGRVWEKFICPDVLASEGPFGTYSCAVFSDSCMSSSFVPGTVLGAGSVSAKMGFSDLRKLRNPLLC